MAGDERNTPRRIGHARAGHRARDPPDCWARSVPKGASGTQPGRLMYLPAMPQRRKSPARSAPKGGPPPPAPSAHRPVDWAGLRVPAVAVVLLWALVFFPQLFLGQRFVLGDAHAFLPFSDFSRARWSETRERTYWNPYVLMGVESVASLADSRPQYLPGPLLDLADRLGRPRFGQQFWLLVAHLAGALAVMLLAVRMLAVTPWSAATAAIAWLLTVQGLVPFAFGHDAQFVADALLPVVALGTQVVITTRSRAGMALGAFAVALGLGLQALHGHPQIAVYTGLLAASMAFHQAWRQRAWRRLLPWSGAVGLGLLVGAAVWWPALIYSAQSFRGAGSEGQSIAEVAKFSLGYRDLLSMVWPHALGYGGPTYWGHLVTTDYTPYLGAALVVLALGALRSRAPGVRFLALVALLAALHGLGSSLGVVYDAIREIPLWSKFRVPFYTAIVTSLALSLLAAKGIDEAAEHPASKRLRAVLLGLAGLAVVGLLLGSGPLRGIYAQIAVATRDGFDLALARRAADLAGWDLVFRCALVAAALVVATGWVRLAPRWRAIVLALLVALDLGSITVPTLMRASGGASEVAAPAPTALARVAKADPRFRAYVGVPEPVADSTLGTGQYLETYTNFWIAWRARCLTGNHGTVPESWRPVMRYEMTRQASVLRAWGVGFLNLPPNTPVGPTLIPVTEEPRSQVYAVAGAQGRAYASPFVVTLADEDQVARAMMTSEFDPTQVAVTTERALEGEYPGSRDCAIRWVRDDPQILALEVEATGPAFLVVADSYASGWTATLDGVATPIVRANLLARGMAVPAGKHRVEMRYETPGMRAGVVATRFGLGIVVILAILAVLRPRPRTGRKAAPNGPFEGP